MALIPKVGPKQERKVVSARLDEEAHMMLQRYANFLGGATHEYIIGESLKHLFRRDKEFKQWLETNHAASTGINEPDGSASPPAKNAVRPVPSPA
jgi:hypothetical protein